MTVAEGGAAPARRRVAETKLLVQRFSFTFQPPLPPGATPEAVLAAVESALLRGRMRDVARSPDRVTFRGRGWFTSGRSPLDFVGGGAVWVERSGEGVTVAYELDFRGMYTWAGFILVLATGIALAFGVARGVDWLLFPLAAAGAAVANNLLARGRFAQLLEDAIRRELTAGPEAAARG